MNFLSLKTWLQHTSLRFRASVAFMTLVLFYLAHFLFCTHSALPDFVYYFTNSDMHANLQWANTICHQGWFNPHPYHPYNDWMHEIAPYEKWVAWWGGDAIFQQSPLYAYLLALFLKVGHNLLYVHLIQCLAGAVLCGLLAILAGTIFENRKIGWVTFLIAGLYAPFYAYSWPLLRDLLSWIIIVSSVLLLTLWCRSWKTKAPVPILSASTGLVLGMGLLARETFYLIIPMALAVLFWKSLSHRNHRPMALLVTVLALTLFPLVLRNTVVGAPWLSTSNRFAENFIEGNAASAKPASLFIPYEMGEILNRSGGKPLQVIHDTFTVHRKNESTHWWRLQFCKIRSLFDPYEPPDNLSLYYLADISPLVRWGFSHWFILIPGIGGLILGIWKRDLRQGWLWAFFLCLLASLLFTTVLSRYRQALALLWIPWAAYFFVALRDVILRKRWTRAAVSFVLLGCGWWLCLNSFAIRPLQNYHRATEYRLAALIYEIHGQPDKARQSLELFQKKRDGE